VVFAKIFVILDILVNANNVVLEVCDFTLIYATVQTNGFLGSSIVTGVLSFVLSTWAEGYPGATSSLCPSNYTSVLPSVTGASALIALTDIMFMVLTLQSFSLSDNS